MPETMYPSLADYYAADERRLRSTEFDFGVWWYDAAPIPTPHRVTWVKATGEFIVLAQRSGPRVAVRVIGGCTDRAAVEKRLAGWAEHCGGRDSLRWIEEKVAALT